MMARLYAGALSPYWAVVGAAGALTGWGYGAFWAIPMGILGAGTMIWYVWRTTRDHNGFEEAFGADWSDHIPHERARLMLQKRWKWFLKMKASPEPSWARDIPFWTIPDTDRQLLCDVWRTDGGDSSGLAFVYLHGSGWGAGDKDWLTRPFFHHLTSQGHAVMDVAYRLVPEVDIYGMIGDVKRAIAWIKTNAPRYGVNPGKIVLGGGSAGCHLALLAAYAPQHSALTPEDVRGADLSVCGVVSLYGPTDLAASYDHWMSQAQSPRRPEDFRYAGRLDLLLGGGPHDMPDTYRLVSPITHVHPGSPPTLLMQGGTDLLVGVDSTRALYARLVESGVPAINVVLPWTEHMFDLILPHTSPPAQTALYDVDRFLALLLNKD
jgi:acetyl esterase/lipase